MKRLGAAVVMSSVMLAACGSGSDTKGAEEPAPKAVDTPEAAAAATGAPKPMPTNPAPTNPAPTTTAATKAPVIDRLPVDPATAVDLAAARYADTRMLAQGPLVASGDVVEGHPGAEPSILLQFLKRDIPVVAGMAGTVVDVKSQPDTCDSEVMIIPLGSNGNNATWVLGYDHIKDPKVKRGDTVAPGDVLGTPGSQSFSCDGPGRVELQINHKTATDELAMCPLTYFPETAKATAQAALRSLMTAWNGQFTKIYTSAKLEAAGCLAESTKP